MMERTAAQTAALTAELRIVVRQAEKLVAALAEDRNEAMSELKIRGSEMLEAAKVRLSGIEEQLQLLKQTAGVAADEYGRENPWTVVVAGAALGLLLAHWLSSPSDVE
jgi:ElaB/YqjD/DUF883 family membrane-anchored ribosome-binding protein